MNKVTKVKLTSKPLVQKIKPKKPEIKSKFKFLKGIDFSQDSNFREGSVQAEIFNLFVILSNDEENLNAFELVKTVCGIIIETRLGTEPFIFEKNETKEENINTVNFLVNQTLFDYIRHITNG